MPCGCKGGSYTTPSERQIQRQQARDLRAARMRVVKTDPRDPGNYWNGPQPKKG